MVICDECGAVMMGLEDEEEYELEKHQREQHPDPPDSANFYAGSERYDPEQSPSYRADMRDAGRGHLLRP